MSPETVEALCSKCGATFTMFLKQMADRNLKVVCPKCAAEECGPTAPSKTASKN